MRESSRLTSMMVLDCNGPRTSTAGGRTGGMKAASTDTGEGPAAGAALSAGRVAAPAGRRQRRRRCGCRYGGGWGGGCRQRPAVWIGHARTGGTKPPVRTLGRDRRLSQTCPLEGRGRRHRGSGGGAGADGGEARVEVEDLVRCKNYEETT